MGNPSADPTPPEPRRSSIWLSRPVWIVAAVAVLIAAGVGFGAIAAVIGTVYMLVRTWVMTVERLAESKHPVMVAVRQGIDSAEDMARRPFRRPGSATAR